MILILHPKILYYTKSSWLYWFSFNLLWLLECHKFAKFSHHDMKKNKSYRIFNLQNYATTKTLTWNNKNKLHNSNSQSPSAIKAHLTISRSADNFNQKMILHCLLSCFVTWQYFGLNFCLYFFKMPWGTLSQFYLCRGNEKDCLYLSYCSWN